MAEMPASLSDTSAELQRVMQRARSEGSILPPLGPGPPVLLTSPLTLTVVVAEAALLLVPAPAPLVEAAALLEAELEKT